MRRCLHLLRIYADVSCKSVVQSLPNASHGISAAVNGHIFQSDVYSTLHPPTKSPCPHKLSRWGGRAVVVLMGIRLVIDGVNSIYYETIKVCDSLENFSDAFDLTSMNTKALYVYSPIISWHSRRVSFASNYFVSSQADSLFYVHPHHTRATVPMRPPTQTQTTERIVSVGSRLGKPSLRGDQYRLHLPAIIVPQRCPCPAAPTRLHSHTQQPRHRPYQNNCPRAALSPKARTCVGTLPARMQWWVGIVG